MTHSNDALILRILRCFRVVEAILKTMRKNYAKQIVESKLLNAIPPANPPILCE